MSMIICSLKGLKEIHEETKKYECYAGLAEEQALILKEIEQSLKDKFQDDVCIEYYKYLEFKKFTRPEEDIQTIIDKFGEETVIETLKNKFNLK